ncbi:hypothetical protein KO489_07945 [Reinekea forsetii]|nr:hypothetical protein [Reinekea forsetii]
MRVLVIVLLICSSFSFGDIYLQSNNRDKSVSVGYQGNSETIYSYEEDLTPTVYGVVTITQGENYGLFIQMDMKGGNCGYKGFLATVINDEFSLNRLDCSYWESIDDNLLLSTDRTKYIGLCGLPTSRSMWPSYPVISKINLTSDPLIDDAAIKDLIQSPAVVRELEKFRSFVLENMNLEEVESESQRAFCGRLGKMPIPDMLSEISEFSD